MSDGRKGGDGRGMGLPEARLGDRICTLHLAGRGLQAIHAVETGGLLRIAFHAVDGRVALGYL